MTAIGKIKTIAVFFIDYFLKYDIIINGGEKMELKPNQEDLEKSREELKEELESLQQRIRTLEKKLYTPGKEGKVTALKIREAEIEAALKEKKEQ